MEILRTPDAHFANLADYPFEPNYHEVDGLRIHYVDEGPRDAAPVLLLHGEPSWSYLYRKMIPPLVAAGHRVLAPDFVGFGRSDKPTRRKDYSYARHVAWMTAWLLDVDARRLTLFCQDWGGLIGLRLAAENPDRFDRIVAANTLLPTGDGSLPFVFRVWRAFSQWSPIFPISKIIETGCARPVAPEVLSAYDAPFPNVRYKAGARAFPKLVPMRPDDPESEPNRKAWHLLEKWEKPFLTAFSDRDPITRSSGPVFRARIPGARGLEHPTIRNAGHFLQEDASEELARVINDFTAKTL
jgi:haloalkane dehalogenase